MLISFTLDKDGFRVSKPLDARFVTNVTYIKAHFDVSESTWDDAQVLVAVFKSATYNETCRMVLDENNNCFIEPKVFMRGGDIQVKLCGDAYDSDGVRCTTHLTDTIKFFIRPESLLTAVPPSSYAVFLAELERVKELFDDTITSFLQRVEDGEFDGADGASVSDIVINDDNTITIILSDGQSFTSEQSVKGEKGDDGEDGVGISSVVFDEDGKLIITLTNGVEYPSPYSVIGEKGDKGDKGDYNPVFTIDSEGYICIDYDLV